METYNENPQETVDETVGSLISHFQGLKISRTTIYDFMTNDCALVMKKAHLNPKTGIQKKVLRRYNWAKSVRNTDIDYLSKCIFIDESGFNINLRRSMAWFKRVLELLFSKTKQGRKLRPF
ncbi:unnamed protein product [Rhizopus stolonifer]